MAYRKLSIKYQTISIKKIEATTNMNKKIVVAVVGLPGSGKTEAVKFFVKNGFTRIYFGDITFEEIQKRGLETNEKNERMIREELRATHGMAAYAILNLDKIKKAYETGPVVVESMYSWQEYLVLKKEFGDIFYVIAVYASPKTRYSRVIQRQETQQGVKRAFTLEEIMSRDKAQIENLATAGPIAMADFTINNEGNQANLNQQIEKIYQSLLQ